MEKEKVMQIQRLIEKDIFASSALAPTAGGDSDIITLDYADKLSCQAVYSGVATPVGASVKFQCSNDRVNWFDIQAATSITVDGNTMLLQPNVAYRYFKAVKAISSGSVTLKAYILVLGG